MSLMSKEAWIECIERYVALDDISRARFASMSLKQLAAVEHLLACQEEKHKREIAELRSDDL